MEKKLEELVFILDKSGSMSGKEEDTIGSFNSVINEHREKDYDVFVTTVLFSDDNYTLHDRIDIKEVKPMTEKEYKTNGCTALIDAIGKTIEKVTVIQNHQRSKEDIPEHTLFVIVTDGEENSSYKYSSDEVKKMVEKQKELGWEFLFLGANIDAVESAKHFGINESRAVNYINDKKGIKKAYNFVDSVCESYFQCPKGMVVENSNMDLLRKDVDDDYLKRNKNK